jgi:sRNA-binding carbon storage regulator CsrA
MQMLVLSRFVGEYIHISSHDEGCLVTLMNVARQPPVATVMVNRASAARPGILETRSFDLTPGATVALGSASEITLVHATEEKARLGINAPKGPE